MLKINLIILLGHSLGAHLAGQIGRELKNESFYIPRITGLDPANPCFYMRNLLRGLSAGDARFTDVVHTNPGTFGKKERIGDVDFYPTGSEDQEYVRGCEPRGWIEIDLFYKGSACSHRRAWQYYAESIVPGNEYNFLPTSCVLDDKTVNCDPENYPMGFAANASYKKGKFYLNANEECPYGQNRSNNSDKSVCDIFPQF